MPAVPSPPALSLIILLFLRPNSTVIGPNFSSGPPALISKNALVADAGLARVFPIDPVSQADATNLHHRRPTRSDPTLDYYRTTVGPLPSTPQPLVYAPDGYDDEVVFVCPGFVLEDYGLAPATRKRVNLPGGGPPVRSNDFSAVMAYWNVRQFFDRLRAYGLPPDGYFRIAPLPLEVYYRSGVRPGPGKDGQTVNARVSVKGLPDNFEGPVPLGSIIEMHLALADLSTRARKPWDGIHRSPAVPLGIAADARWIWHEIGHVLLTTSVGELQFRFAHSPGDALAAIVLDSNWSLQRIRIGGARLSLGCFCRGGMIGVWRMDGAGVAILHHALSQVPDSAGPRRKSLLERADPLLVFVSSVPLHRWRHDTGWLAAHSRLACPQVSIALLRLPYHARDPHPRYFDGRTRK